LDNPWGIDPEEETEDKKEEEKVLVDNPWGIEPEDDDDDDDDDEEEEILEQEYQTQPKGEDQQKQQIVPPSPGDINVDDIFASLQRQQQAVANDIASAYEEENMRPTTTTNTDDADVPTEEPTTMKNNNNNNNDENFDPAYAFKREGVASKQISPRDFRVAAASNEYDTLQEYLSLVPEHINRQDKFGWTALHLATRSGQENIIRLLLQSKFNCDVTIVSNKGETAFDVANDRFGFNHPITQLFIESGLYNPDDYYEEYDDDELKDVKEFVNEEIEAKKAENERIAEQNRLEEEESRISKEKKLAKIAEKERQIKEEKLRKLFKQPIIEDDDDYNNEDDGSIHEDLINLKRSRLDAVLDRDEL
ncbi:MAG: hypothetical protein ACI90V_008351, partial [Bacillariaceae sp.]